MGNKFTPSTYKRITQDENYTNKAIDSFLRAENGHNVQYEVVGNKVVINGGKILDKNTVMAKAVDFQAILHERPALEKLYQDRQKRIEQAQPKSNPNLQEKSANEMMAEGAMKAMLSNAGRRTLASKQTEVAKSTSHRTNLPSERD